jgi:formate dehydrogenase subunit gamma
MSNSRNQVVLAIAEAHTDTPGHLLEVLHDVMAEFGWINKDDVAVIADALNLSQAEVYGVISFYHDFRTAPPPEARIRICRGEACQAVGAQQLFDECRAQIGAQARVEVAEVFCLGNCALGPSGLINGKLLGRLTTPKVMEALA